MSKNIIFSGWPSSGGSTQARIVSILFGMKYIYAGGVLKYWVKQMGYDPKTSEIMDWTRKYGDHWDYVWENYIQLKAQEATNTVFEGKTAGFLIDSDNVYKIFIKADIQARLDRSKGDGREESIIERDKFLRKQWKETLDVDIFDEAEIERKYDFVLNTSKMSIEAIANMIIERLDNDQVISFEINEIKTKLNNLMSEYVRNNEILQQRLTENSLILEPASILEEINSKYSHLIKAIPQEMQNSMN